MYVVNLFIGETMKPQIKLLLTLKELGIRQREFARLAGENQGQLSMMINGKMFIDEHRKIKFARLLGKTVEDLFDEPASALRSAAPPGPELCYECRSKQDRYK